MSTSSEQIAEILSQLKAEPYYSVRITPVRVMESLSMAEARRAVSENAIRLRGWDFPHFEASAVYTGSSYVFSSVNWEKHVELWRMYQSRQFVYLGTSWDTAMDHQTNLRTELSRMILPREFSKESVRGLLSFIGIIYSITEFYLFASRLSSTLGYRDHARLEVVLHNVEGWALASGDPHVHWSFLYQSHLKEVRLPAPAQSELITEADAAAAARKGLLELFARFNWDNSAGAIEDWQKRLIERRFA